MIQLVSGAGNAIEPTILVCPPWKHIKSNIGLLILLHLLSIMVLTFLLYCTNIMQHCAYMIREVSPGNWENAVLNPIAG